MSEKLKNSFGLINKLIMYSKCYLLDDCVWSLCFCLSNLNDVKKRHKTLRLHRANDGA